MSPAAPLQPSLHHTQCEFALAAVGGLPGEGETRHRFLGLARRGPLAFRVLGVFRGCSLLVNMAETSVFRGSPTRSQA